MSTPKRRADVPARINLPIPGRGWNTIDRALLGFSSLAVALAVGFSAASVNTLTSDDTRPVADHPDRTTTATPSPDRAPALTGNLTIADEMVRVRLDAAERLRNQRAQEEAKKAVEEKRKKQAAERKKARKKALAEKAERERLARELADSIADDTRNATSDPTSPTASPTDTPMTVGSPGYSVETMKAAARMLMLDAGFDADQWTYLDQLITKESGWNPTATNSTSGAYGLPQSLPGNKMATTGDDWKTNPTTQIKWMLKYIKDRYGNPEAAWGHSESVGWY